jgi:hypothetical protein
LPKRNSPVVFYQPVTTKGDRKGSVAKTGEVVW